MSMNVAVFELRRHTESVSQVEDQLPISIQPLERRRPYPPHFAAHVAHFTPSDRVNVAGKYLGTITRKYPTPQARPGPNIAVSVCKRKHGALWMRKFRGCSPLIFGPA